MASTRMGTRGVYQEGVEEKLPYMVYDADNHIYPPEDAAVRHLEKKYVDRVFPTGKTHRGTTEAIGGDEHKAKTLGFHTVGQHAGVDPLAIPEMKGDIPVPGAMLNRLNAMQNLDKDGREKLVQLYRDMEPAFENRDLRLKLMDAQGVQAAIIHAGGGGGSAFSRGDVSAGYAAARAMNRYINEDWGFNYKERIYTPAYIPLIDIDLAVDELERCMNEGARLIGLSAGGSHGRSPADPYFDPFWSRVNEAKLRVVIHLSGPLAHRGAEWSEDPDAQYAQFNGFQWLFFWSDFPIMETIGMLFFHGFLTRFPDINFLIAEFGTPWLPYLVRKMDHAHMLGRNPKWGGKLPMRPSELFKARFVVAPFPEENVQRPIEVVGHEGLVFGSDFPLGGDSGPRPVPRPAQGPARAGRQGDHAR